MREADERRWTQDDDTANREDQPKEGEPESFSTIGATEDETADRDREVAPGFTDMEPGAGPDYGPSGEPGPDAPEDPNQQDGQGFTAPEVTGETEDGSTASDH